MEASYMKLILVAKGAIGIHGRVLSERKKMNKTLRWVTSIPIAMYSGGRWVEKSVSHRTL